MRLGAEPGRPRRGDEGPRRLRRDRRLRAPPPPLRGEQPLPAAARRRGPRRLRHLPGGPARRGDRAARSSVVRRQPVPPGVQVAPDPSGAALPRLRRAPRSCTPGQRASPAPPSIRRGSPRRAVGGGPRATGAAYESRRAARAVLRSLHRARRDPEPVRDTSAPSPSGSGASSATSGSRPVSDDSRRPDRLGHGQPLRAASSRPRRRARRSSSARTSTRSSRPGRSSRWSRTASSATAAGTILGADNKAAVAAMLEAVRAPRREPAARRHRARLHDARGDRLPGRARVRHVAARAHASGSSTTTQAPIGDVVVAAPYQRTLDVVFAGRAAHAGINPEDGRSAIQAAARAIADLRLGRLDDETTANVGQIAGGTARNVVPERCAVTAEARSRDEAKLLALVQEMVDTFAFAASVCDCDVETSLDELYRGYRLEPDDPALRLGFAGARALRLRAAGRRGRRRRRRQRLQRARASLRRARERHGADPQPRRAHRGRRPRRDGRGDARARRRGARDAGVDRLRLLTLRRGTRHGRPRAGTRARPARGRRAAVRRLPAPHRPGGARRRRRREHPGRRSRARLGRLRRAPREPHAGPRAARPSRVRT